MHKAFATALFALVALTAPAAAQSDAADALESLDNPQAVEAIADSLEATTDALLAMPVGPLARAIREIDPDSLGEIAPDATLGDLTGHDGDFSKRLGDDARVSGLVAGQAARDLAAALPLIDAMARDLAAQWRARIADAQRNQR